MQDLQSSSISTVTYGSKIGIQVCDGRFVQANYNWPNELRANVEHLREWETFTVVPTDPGWDAWGWWVCYGHRIALRACNQSYVQSDLNQAGQLHAYDYTKIIQEWEIFEVVAVEEHILQGYEAPAPNTPVSFGERLALRDYHGRFVSCDLSDAGRHLAAGAEWSREWERLRFVSPLLLPGDTTRSEVEWAREQAAQTVAAHERLLQAVQQQVQEKDAEAVRHMKEARQLRKKLAERDQQLAASDERNAQWQQRAHQLHTQQEQVEKRERTLSSSEAKLRQGQQDLAALQGDVVALTQHLKQLVQGEQGKHEQLQADLVQERKRFQELQTQIKAQQAQAQEVQRQCAQTQTLLSQEQQAFKQLTQQLENLREQYAQANQDLAQVKARHDELLRREPDLAFLAQRREELRFQIGLIEQRLQPQGSQAESLEKLMEMGTQELIVLSQNTLDRMRPVVQQAVERAHQLNETLRETEHQVREAQRHEQDAETLLNDRLVALRLYQEANALVAAQCPGANNSAEALNSIERMLGAVDEALGQVIHANQVAGALPHIVS